MGLTAEKIFTPSAAGWEGLDALNTPTEIFDDAPAGHVVPLPEGCGRAGWSKAGYLATTALRTRLGDGTMTLAESFGVPAGMLLARVLSVEAAVSFTTDDEIDPAKFQLFLGATALTPETAIPLNTPTKVEVSTPLIVNKLGTSTDALSALVKNTPNGLATATLVWLQIRLVLEYRFFPQPEA